MAALIQLAGEWRAVGFAAWAQIAIDELGGIFDHLQALLLDPWVPRLASLLDRLVPWPLSLPSDWRNLFTLLTLYLGAHVREAFGAGVPHRWRAFLIRLVAAVVGVVAATFLALLLDGTSLSRVEVSVLGFLLGVVIYRIGFAAQFAADRARATEDSQPFKEEFTRKVRGVVPISFGAVVTLGVARLVGRGAGTRGDFFWVLLLVFGLGAFHFLLARDRPETTGNRNISVRILVSATLALLLVFGMSTRFRDLITF